MRSRPAERPTSPAASRRVTVGEPVQPIVAQAETLRPGHWQRIGGDGLRWPGVERGVEPGHGGRAGEQRRGVDAGQRQWLVQRR